MKQINNFKNVKQLIVCICCIAVGFSFTIPYLSYATTKDDLENANESLENLKSQQESLSGKLSQLNTELEKTGSRLAELDTQINEKQSAINSLEDEIAQISSDMNTQYDSMKLRIRYMYERDSSDILELLLTSKSLSEFLVKGEYIRQLTEYDRAQLEAMEELFARQSSAKEELDTDLADLSDLKTQALEQQSQINTLLAQINEEYNNTSDNVSEAESIALAYEKQLEEERIERERAEAEAASREAASRQAEQEKATNSAAPKPSAPIQYNPSDLAMLAAIIECEAGGESYYGKLAVGSVVLNRVNSSRFANSISSVIYSPGQFTPVASGRFSIVLAHGANASCVQAAQEVLNGNIVIDALYFHVYRSNIDTYGTVIGGHIFY